MERVSRIHVEGFRSFRQLDIELGGLTVLIGANGSGKSNLVGFFEMLSHLVAEDLRVYVARQGGASCVLHYGPKQTPELGGEIEFAGDAGTSTYRFTLAFASPDGLIFVAERVAHRTMAGPTHSQLQLGAGQSESQVRKLSLEVSDPDGLQVATRFVHQLRELRTYHFHDTTAAASVRTSQDMDSNLSLKGDAGNLASFLYMLQETKPQHFDHIVSTVRLAVPYLKEFILEPDRLNPKRIQLRWRDRAPEYEFGPHQFSDGSLRVIALTTALLQPEETLPSIIVIDEPELGLHPSAIGLIANLIKEAATTRQVIVATQSPRLLAEFTPADVLVAEREEDERGYGESRLRRLSEQDLSAWLEDYDLGELYEKNVTGGWPS